MSQIYVSENGLGPLKNTLTLRFELLELYMTFYRDMVPFAAALKNLVSRD